MLLSSSPLVAPTTHLVAIHGGPTASMAHAHLARLARLDRNTRRFLLDPPLDSAPPIPQKAWVFQGVRLLLFGDASVLATQPSCHGTSPAVLPYAFRHPRDTTLDNLAPDIAILASALAQTTRYTDTWGQDTTDRGAGFFQTGPDQALFPRWLPHAYLPPGSLESLQAWLRPVAEMATVLLPFPRVGLASARLQLREGTIELKGVDDLQLCVMILPGRGHSGQARECPLPVFLHVTGREAPDLSGISVVEREGQAHLHPLFSPTSIARLTTQHARFAAAGRIQGGIGVLSPIRRHHQTP